MRKITTTLTINMKSIMIWSGVAAGLVLSAPLWYGTGGQCPVLSGGKSQLSVQALPAMARKYNADCTLCHTMWPRLNRTGYIFRRLGYRMPYEVNEKKGTPSKSKASVSKGPISGKEVFEKKAACVGCHPGGGNVINPQKLLKGPEFASKFHDDASIATVIRAGIPGTSMPAYGEDKISADEMTALIKYIHSLK